MGLSNMIKNAAGKYAGRAGRPAGGSPRTGGLNTGRGTAGTTGAGGIGGKIRSILNRR